MTNDSPKKQRHGLTDDELFEAAWLAAKSSSAVEGIRAPFESAELKERLRRMKFEPLQFPSQSKQN